MKRLVVTTVLLSLVACPAPQEVPVLSSGIWQETHVFDPGQGESSSPWKSGLYEINFTSSGVTGWRYGCNHGWIDCAPKGYGLPLEGTLSKGAADFSFTYKPLSNTDPGTKFQITGTFSTAGFVGRFKQTSTTSTSVGSITMVWIKSQR